MDKSFSIMFMGLNAHESAFVYEHLSKSGYRIINVRSIPEAKEVLKSKRVDVLYYKAASDYTAIRELEEISPQMGSLPIVLVCANPTDSFVLNAWHAGAADVVFLPLTSGSLEASVKRRQNQCTTRKSEQMVSPIQDRFVYRNEQGVEVETNILRPKFSIGRSQDNDLVLRFPGISRFHAEVTCRNGECWIRDLGSKSGTLVNGVNVEQTRLSEGDRVQLGGLQGTVLLFREGDLLQSLLDDSDSKAGVSMAIHGFKDVGRLFAAFHAFNSISVLDDLLALVVDTAIDLTGADRGFIMLKEKNGNLGFRCARNNKKQSLADSRFKTSQLYPIEVFNTGRSIAIRDLDLDTELELHLATRGLGLRSISCVPLRYVTVHEHQNSASTEYAENIGVLYVDSSSGGTGFSPAKLEALESLASEAALAIYNTKLYKESQEKRKLDEQLELAQKIQQALLPQPAKELPYAQVCCQAIPCSEVGGDYYDYFTLEDGRFGFALGDVAGKGISAALLASFVQGILSAQDIARSPLPIMMERINRILLQHYTASRFVTFFFGILDPDGNCTYVNAGHNPPFLLDRSGALKELIVGGTVLGLFADIYFETAAVKLQAGDHIVLFTDGVTDALNASGEEFGLQRLQVLLRDNAQAKTPEILARLREAVLSFSSNEPQNDDITMMILGYRE